MISAKLDRILAGQEKQDRALADLEIAFGAVVQGVSGLMPLLSQQTELLSLIHEAATREPAGDGDLAEMLQKLLAAMERIEDGVTGLAGQMRQAVQGAA
ncbi:hypothetical protein RQ832_01370 [Roseomonas sp. DSM 102946]|nr:hypothetical protein [Roseomonas sp. DSM 102946]